MIEIPDDIQAGIFAGVISFIITIFTITSALQIMQNNI